jgi:hypothetical protein
MVPRCAEGLTRHKHEHSTSVPSRLYDVKIWVDHIYQQLGARRDIIAIPC